MKLGMPAILYPIQQQPWLSYLHFSEHTQLGHFILKYSNVWASFSNFRNPGILIIHNPCSVSFCWSLPQLIYTPFWKCCSCQFTLDYNIMIVFPMRLFPMVMNEPPNGQNVGQMVCYWSKAKISNRDSVLNIMLCYVILRSVSKL